ncbi:AIM24 family protein [Nocardia flavorosea]|uniref:AIM24 family protein n=1 Tax=Nocardia flavorosea TaxID=53429 RepID=A0A846YLL5_9NOCA|nr:AIM24 family protein [Nocardia flavorosea]NKY58484.1 AIM24 family protein [Nocardia flavorosea]
MQSEIFANENMAQPATAPGLTAQSTKALKYAVNGECLARQGSMVAFRGSLQFEKKGQGVGKFLQRALTGEGVPLMSVRGQGEAWFAHFDRNCFLVDLVPGDALTINGRNILVFDSSLQYDIRMVQGVGMAGGGLFNCVFTGQGRLGLVCAGTPIIIPVHPQAPVFVDTDAVVGWSAQLQTSLNRSQSFGSMVRGGSGEAFQLRLDGEGFVIVQPSEA